MTDYSQHKDLPFEVSEYRERIRRTKESMSERGIDVLVEKPIARSAAP